MMKTSMNMTVGVLAALALACGVADAQPAKTPSNAKTIDLSKYPTAVRTTIEAETRSATLKGVSKETEKGKTQYEVETLIGGKSRDLLIDPSGKVIEVEEELAVDAAPAAVQAALKQYAKVIKLEKVTRDGTVSYEASVQGKNGKKSSLALDAQGKPLKG